MRVCRGTSRMPGAVVFLRVFLFVIAATFMCINVSNLWLRRRNWRVVGEFNNKRQRVVFNNKRQRNSSMSSKLPKSKHVNISFPVDTSLPATEKLKKTVPPRKEGKSNHTWSSRPPWLGLSKADILESRPFAQQVSSFIHEEVQEEPRRVWDTFTFFNEMDLLE